MDMTNVFVLALFMVLFLFIAAFTGFSSVMILIFVAFIVVAAVALRSSPL